MEKVFFFFFLIFFNYNDRYTFVHIFYCGITKNTDFTKTSMYRIVLRFSQSINTSLGLAVPNASKPLGSLQPGLPS